MKNKKIICIALLCIVALAGAISCDQGDLQAEYDILAAQYEEANQQLGQLQEKLFEAQILQTQYDELMVQYDELTDENKTALDEIASLEAQIADLESEIEELSDEIEMKIGEIADLVFDYDELKAQYDALVSSAMEITEGNVEEALLALISQERKSNGLNELTIGSNLQNWSRINSQRMYVSKQTEYYDDNPVPFQRVYIAVGYESLDQLVNAAMTFWQSHALTYQDNILDEDAIYGAVGVVKSGDICYITFMGSNYP